MCYVKTKFVKSSLNMEIFVIYQCAIIKEMNILDSVFYYLNSEHLKTRDV